MSELELVIPQLEHHEMVMAYRAEFLENNEHLAGCSSLAQYEDYEEWLKDVHDFMDEKSVRDGFVVSDTLLAIRKNDQHLVGMVNNRYKLTDFLMNVGGHIGYSVRKSERKKGYATEMLKLALLYYPQKNIEQVLVTCDKENLASAKVIQNNGGQLEDERTQENKIT